MKLNAVTAVTCQKTGELVDTAKCKWCNYVIRLYYKWNSNELISGVYCSYGDEHKKVWMKICGDCGGTGIKDELDVDGQDEKCPKCEGKGEHVVK